MVTIVYLISFGAIYHLWHSPNTTLFWLVVGLTVLLFWVVATVQTASKDVIRANPHLRDYTPMELVNADSVIRFWSKASVVVSVALIVISIYAFFQ